MNLDVREAIEDDDESLLEIDVTDPPATAEVGAAPRWLADLRGSNGKGFYHSLGDYALVFADRDSEHLLVSFDNLSSARDDTLGRDPWGYSFVAKNGWSQLGVMAFVPGWFRDEALFDELHRLAESGFFRRFRSVTLTGTSMGGYAACAFASLVPGCRVIAFSPQSTLMKDLVPWERRFSSGRKADWSGRFVDAPSECAAASKVWLVYDPHFEPDVSHVDRFKAANTIRLPARHAGHKSALFLRRAGVLSTIMREAIQDELTPTSFFRSCREGRKLPWYVNGLAEQLMERGNGRLLARLIEWLRNAELRGQARNIEKRAADAGLLKAPKGQGKRKAKKTQHDLPIHAEKSRAADLPVEQRGHDSEALRPWQEKQAPSI
ncbi:hypothetical protein RGQ15_01535 [Paracoccus sp. MBLB3053]|uniref:Phosphoadenosine phosphosulfate reductase n=1 Tax=Paracoccus aurantius TaxID=3073814 RepID=A0ABU2HNQ1_9RHOB|nr:hypothetical protein [Paracoccus sp. MBLB3053]MDS9466254.1 hypothetical protein [Paracoccus sp. MBLB3053]